MVTITPTLAAEHASGIDFGTVKRYHKYKGVDKYLQHACNAGGILRDHHLYSIFREQGFDLDDNRDNKSQTDVLYLFDLLALYGKSRGFQPHAGHLQQAFGKAWSNFGFRSGDRKLKVLDTFDEHAVFASIRMDKSSGFPSFTKKADDIIRAVKCHAKWYDSLSNAKRLRLPPCVAYSRVQHGDSGPKTRLVWGYALEATLAEARFARPLIDKFLHISTPMAFGLHRFELGAKLQRISNFGLTYGLDYSKFDTSVHPVLICEAFKILKSHFDLEESDELCWDAIVQHFIHTPIIMPDGHLYVKHSGVPSGSYFTQLVDSIVNYIIVQYSIIHLTGSGIRDTSILVLGDDSVFSLPDYLPIEAISKVVGDLGFSVNVAKSYAAKSGTRFHFLGHMWERLVINRDIEDVVKRLVYPERFVSRIPLKELRRTRIAGYSADGRTVGPFLRTLLLQRNPDAFGTWLNCSISMEPVTGYQEWLDTMPDGFDATGGISKSPSSGALAQAYLGVWR